MGLNDTPRGNRLHIGIYGKRNSGKSSLINALTGQDIALVSPEAGTTTDPIFKAMELHPTGPVVFIDTAGFDDEGQLGKLRVERTREVMDKTDIAIVVIDGEKLAKRWKSYGLTPDEEAMSDEEVRIDNGIKVDKESRNDKGIKYDEEVTPDEGMASENAVQFLNDDFDSQSALNDEKKWIAEFELRNIPVIIAVNKLDAFLESVETNKSDALAEKVAVADCDSESADHIDQSTVIGRFLTEVIGILGVGERHAPTDVADTSKAGIPSVIAVSAAKGLGLEDLRKAIQQTVPEDFLREKILGDLIDDGGLALLVMPQDIQAPKGRLILPQVQTLRELLDRRCISVATTIDGFEKALAVLERSPDLIITDSQCFRHVYERKPAVSALTSFSVLFAAYKGDIGKFVEGASLLDEMTEKSRVLIAEACTHVPLSEDIGREKIPRLLHKKFGSKPEIVNVCGNDFPEPEELKSFDLVIHCGACMFNRKHVMNRIAAAEAAGVPITNYGVVLAKLAGILEKITIPK